MTSAETLLTDDDFDTGFEPEILDEGKYKVKCIKSNPRIRVSKAGNRYLSIGLAAVEAADGSRVNSKIIYHTVPVEGTDKNGEPLRRMFAGFFSALGLDKAQVRSIYAALVANGPDVDTIGGTSDTEVVLELDGTPFSLEGRTLMAKVKQDTYEGKTKNVISSTWAAKTVA